MSVLIQNAINVSGVFFEDFVASVLMFLGGQYSDYFLKNEENEAITYTLHKTNDTYLICGIYTINFTFMDKDYELKLPYQCFIDKESMKVLGIMGTVPLLLFL